MKSRKTTAGKLVPLALGLLLVAPGIPGVAETVTVSGEVEAAEYDEDGTVVAVAIRDEAEGSVLVLKSGKGAELLQRVGAIVSAVGEIRELDDERGYSYGIVVSSYTLDRSEDDPERGN